MTLEPKYFDVEINGQTETIPFGKSRERAIAEIKLQFGVDGLFKKKVKGGKFIVYDGDKLDKRDEGVNEGPINEYQLKVSPPSLQDDIIKAFQFVKRNATINIPNNGIGKMLLKRSDFVQEQIDNIIDENIISTYYRGPTGSGKSVLLQLLGEALTEKGYPVYHMPNAGDLNKLYDEDFKKLEEKHKDRKVFLLIDEVQANTNSARWTYLLKTETNIIIIGFGIPWETAISPQFEVKKNPQELFFRMRDMDDELKTSLVSMLASNLGDEATISNTDISAVVETMIPIVLLYTGGHAFPFLKILEYCCTDRSKDSMAANGTVTKIIMSSDFMKSKCYEQIVTRAFAWEDKLVEPIDEILSKGVKNKVAENDLFKLGYGNKEKNWFISDFFLSFIFKKYQMDNPEAVDGSKFTMRDIIEVGLSELNPSHFSPRDEKGVLVNRYENSISWCIVFHMAQKNEALEYFTSAYCEKR